MLTLPWLVWASETCRYTLTLERASRSSIGSLFRTSWNEGIGMSWCTAQLPSKTSMAKTESRSGGAQRARYVLPKSKNCRPMKRLITSAFWWDLKSFNLKVMTLLDPKRRAKRNDFPVTSGGQRLILNQKELVWCRSEFARGSCLVPTEFVLWAVDTHWPSDRIAGLTTMA